MPITEAKLEARSHHIGASDVFKIVSKQGIYDMWLEKCPEGQEPRVTGQNTETRSMRWGTILEPELMRWAGEQLAEQGELLTVETMKHETLNLAANLDKLLAQHVTHKPITVVEGKTSGLTGANTSYRTVDGWRYGFGDPDLNELGDPVIFQVQAQLMCLASATGVEAAYAYVPALLKTDNPNDGLVERMYRVELDGDICEWIAEEVQAFWELVKRGIPPENCPPPSLDVVKRMKRVPAKTISIPYGMWAELDSVRQAKNQLKKRAKVLSGKLQAAMGDAEYGVFPGREGAVKISTVHIAESKPRVYDRTDVRFVKNGVPENESE